MPTVLANLYTTRGYNGPVLTSNTSTVKLAGNLDVSQLTTTFDANVAHDLYVGNTAIIDTIQAQTVTVTETLAAGNIAASNHVTADYVFSNVNTYGGPHTILFDQANVQYSTNSVGKVMYGSVWVGNGVGEFDVVHDWNVNANLYSVNATIADTSHFTQLCVPCVFNKTSNAFSVRCVPSNASANASVSFVVTELVMSHDF